MAVKKNRNPGIKGETQKVTGVKLDTKTGTASAAFPLKAAGPRRVSKPGAKTIELRLEDKAVAADTKVFAGPSLGQMSRAARRKLLFG